jgi:hypothetical protein
MLRGPRQAGDKPQAAIVVMYDRQANKLEAEHRLFRRG